MNKIEQIKRGIINGTPSTYKIINKELFDNFKCNITHDLIHDPKYNLFVGQVRISTENKKDRYLGIGYFKASDFKKYGFRLIKKK